MPPSQTIKSEAIRLFALQGYDGTALSEIAKAVGIKTPSLYAHIDSKETLFMELFDDIAREHTEHLRVAIEAAGHSSLEERLFAVIRESCGDYTLSEVKSTFLKRSLFFPPAYMRKEIQGRFLEAEQSLRGLLSSLFEEGVADGTLRSIDVEQLIASFLCLMDGTFIQTHYYGAEEFGKRLPDIWKLYWAGIAAQ
ncbi:TetR/AcrR family transcriptional regulator [Paenibacillus koleovorans]|uniref:TetR/AcrR family transcriptional regulator n=1 Tax=Paenibacillus koleovorans TaxID=121608 RepID=UPI000FD83A8F|nr:TetR/AcrR family transcriptional regulator [Paenibacillus koleovorans]